MELTEENKERCCRCGKEKGVNEFYTNSKKGIPLPHCKDCHKLSSSVSFNKRGGYNAVKEHKRKYSLEKRIREWNENNPPEKDNAIWRDIDGSPDYEVSFDGQVRKWKRYKSKYHYLKQHPNKDGYPIVSLSSTNKRKSARVHRIVAEAFLQAVKGEKEVNHKDAIKSNNSATNLEWCTRSENMKHAYDLGLTGLNKWKQNTSVP